MLVSWLNHVIENNRLNRLLTLSTIVYSCCTIIPLSRLGEGWDPGNVFNPTTLCMYVPFPSQEPVIQWLSFVYVLHICFSFIFSSSYK